MSGLDLGLIVSLGEDLGPAFARVRELGLPTCQLSTSPEGLSEVKDPSLIKRAEAASGVRASAVFIVFQGQVYDRVRGPATAGLVPPDLREERLGASLRASDFLKEAGVRDLVFHMGFIPDDQSSPLYTGFLGAAEKLLARMEANGQRLLFETGQETASALARTLRDLDAPHAGVNLDPANLILYGMSNPLDAVELLGERVRGFHAKDGLWPNRDDALGVETPLGEGAVPFELIIPRLKELGFKGPVTIEREITGPKQREDILKAIKVLEGLVR